MLVNGSRLGAGEVLMPVVVKPSLTTFTAAALTSSPIAVLLTLGSACAFAGDQKQSIALPSTPRSTRLMDWKSLSPATPTGLAQPMQRTRELVVMPVVDRPVTSTVYVCGSDSVMPPTLKLKFEMSRRSKRATSIVSVFPTGAPVA